MPAQKVPQIRTYSPGYLKVYYIVDGVRFDSGRLLSKYLREVYGWGRVKAAWEVWKVGVRMALAM